MGPERGQRERRAGWVVGPEAGVMEGKLTLVARYDAGWGSWGP